MTVVLGPTNSTINWSRFSGVDYGDCVCILAVRNSYALVAQRLTAVVN